MPLQDDMQLVSTDDHLIEHPRVWQDRLPARQRERGPRIVETTEDVLDGRGRLVRAGQQVWVYEGRLYPQLGLNAVAGRPKEEYGADPVRYDEMLRGCYDPRARVEDMDRDGVQANLCFPSFPRFAGTVFLEGTDKELAGACVRAYNDFVLDEWCAVAPDRFIPLVILPAWDVAEAVAEVERTAAKGAKAVAFPENPVPLGLPSLHTDHWDPLFSAIEETSMPVCMHFGTSGQSPTTAPEAPMAVTITLMGCNSMYAVADLLFSPVFHRHPRLRVALSEGGVGWIPYLLERADFVWERHRFYQEIDQGTRPSELFRRHVWGCFIDDEFGVRNRHEVGISQITWESDYPHSDSNWPNSRARLATLMAEVPDDEAARIVEWNARELFSFPRSAA